jgi:hypothetical protein
VSGRRVELTDLLRQIASVATDLPPGAEVAVTWWDAPPDLVLVLAMQPGGQVRSAQLGSGGEVVHAEWKCGAVQVRAQRSSNPNG